MKTSGYLFFEVALRNCPLGKEGLFAQYQKNKPFSLTTVCIPNTDKKIK
jgi:hypothetical protein